jgi:uncharacterized protein YijF (DUF1287 family)
MRGQNEVQRGCIMSPIQEYKPRINELLSVPIETDVVAAARRQIGVTVGYDPSYRKIGYPGGDVPMETGVCSDVTVRALRVLGLDLQKEMHEDIRRNFSAYPCRRMWGQRKPDRNIDHRRVPNQEVYFKRRGWSKPVTKNPADYLPGDIVTCLIGDNIPHVMIVSDRKSEVGTPLCFHNIGMGTEEEDCLFDFTITGHFRPVLRK